MPNTGRLPMPANDPIPPEMKTISSLWNNFGSIATILAFVAAMGGTYATVTAQGQQVAELNKTMTNGMKDINITLQDFRQTTDKVRGLELALERLNALVNTSNERIAARLDKAIDDGRARNAAQDGVMNEQASNRKLDRADIERLIIDVGRIQDSANRSLPAARGVRN